ncbi:hypothetical protein EOA13_27520 [Mesorhizobium sp. M7A.F.Ca.US.011.01.1.1]|nr:hypothetical protein EOA13_27520 [Mesorhizobium sp. M7A.F.Ca.US.011.01.1.1]
MATLRYDRRKEIDGMWTVFDVFTGLPAEIDGHPYVDLDMEYANEMADVLNTQDVARRLARGDIIDP